MNTRLLPSVIPLFLILASMVALVATDSDHSES